MFVCWKNNALKVTSGQINMRDARVEDVDHGSGSDTDDKESGPPGLNPEQVYTVGVFPSHQSPIYLHFCTKQEKVIIIIMEEKLSLYSFLCVFATCVRCFLFDVQNAWELWSLNLIYHLFLFWGIILPGCLAVSPYSRIRQGTKCRNTIWTTCT